MNFLRELRMRLRAFRGHLHNKRYEMKIRPWRHDSKVKEKIIDDFHKLYYDRYGLTWGNTFWRGFRIEKCPLDLWVYQEIIFDLKPDYIIECGTRFGGSALFFADICELAGNGTVLSIDIELLTGRPEHARIKYLTGSSVSENIIQEVKRLIIDGNKTMVILDSDHSSEHVQKELQIYAQFVTGGSYLILEDTNLNGHPIGANFGPGPMEALDKFLKYNHDFVIDSNKEKFYLTFNPRGFLRKVN